METNNRMKAEDLRVKITNACANAMLECKTTATMWNRARKALGNHEKILSDPTTGLPIIRLFEKQSIEATRQIASIRLMLEELKSLENPTE